MSSASPLADRPLMTWSQIGRRLAALAPVRDNEDVAQLSIGAQHGDAHTLRRGDAGSR